MNNIEINKENIFQAVRWWLSDEMNCDLYSDDTESRMNALSERIDNHPCLDAKSKKQLINEIRFTLDVAASDSFDNGLRIGLSVLTNLLNGETPTVKVEREEPLERPKRYTPVYAQSPEFIEYMANASKHLSADDKLKLMGSTDALIEDNRNKTGVLF